MKDLEFREKTYEKYFFAEISQKTNTMFPPDQIDENKLGFDDAFMLPTTFISEQIIYISRSKSRKLTGIEINTLQFLLEELAARMPKFRCNLFVQYKRPRYLESPGASKWSYWGCPYFEYKIEPHQQETLKKIHLQSLGRALVVYAAPAFWMAENLFEFAASGAIVRNSNIANVTIFGAHSRFTYASAGNIGRGHSESEQLLSTDIDQMLREGMAITDLTFRDHILHLSKLILRVIQEDQISLESYNRAKNVDLVQRLVESDMDDNSLLAALFAIKWFQEAFGIRIYSFS